ncbi:hypothetical protein [Agrobacterium pusense]|uniref:hypothetical protein n=1 Tax=Agrobacterium pusense TaxID=648995 RepID=UPI001EF02CE6|nr:hypothetical protein [Agrobacterium pusense]
MRYATFNESGFPVGFYKDEFHGGQDTDGAIEISEADWIEFLNYLGKRKRKHGGIVPVGPPIPPDIGPTISDYRENAIQNLVDSIARERQCRDGVTLAFYIGSTKQKWAEEAQAFIAWRGNVWLYAYG